MRTSEGRRVVVTAGRISATYAAGDRAAEALAMVNLVEGGWAKQVEIARAFCCSARTVRRHERRFEEGGLAGPVRSAGYPQGRPRLPVTRQKTIERLKARYGSNREVARRVGVTEKAVRKVLKRLGWKEPEPEQMRLSLGLSGGTETESASGRDAAAGADPNLSGSRVAGADPNLSGSRVAGADPNLSARDGSDEAAPASFDADPSDRRVDRLLACLGLLDDAAPLFGSATNVPQAGVLLALPALVDSGVFAVARAVYGSLGPAFYGLRTTFLMLLLMALLRIKRPEGLKEVSPVSFGQGSSSPPTPTPASSRCCPPSSPRSAPSSDPAASPSSSTAAATAPTSSATCSPMASTCSPTARAASRLSPPTASPATRPSSMASTSPTTSLLSQPFFVAEQFREGEEIVDGKCDDLPEQAFYYVGTIEEAREKAKTL